MKKPSVPCWAGVSTVSSRIRRQPGVRARKASTWLSPSSRISEQTVRSHLKSVFTKTGVSRQASHVNLLNSTTVRHGSTLN